MFSFVFLLNLLVVYLPLLFIGYFMPNFTRKTLLFGIVIPEEVNDNEEVLKIKKSYKRNYGLSSIGIAMILSAISIKTQNVDYLNYGVLILVANMSVNYLYAHNKSKLLKKEKGWIQNKKQVVIVDTSHRYNQKYLSHHWFWIPIGIIAFTTVFTMIQYPYLPSKVPIHFDLYGNITNYTNKSFLSVFGLPLTQIGMTVLFYIIYRVIQNVRPSIQASMPKTSLKQNQIAKRYWAIYMLVTSVIINIQFAYIQLNVLQITDPKSKVSFLIYGLSVFVPIVGAILVAIKTGQSGSRIKIDHEEEINNKVIDRDDDRFWKWGMFYYNPDDPNLHVEKRFGIGWTINFGRPAGMAIMIILVISIAVSIILS